MYTPKKFVTNVSRTNKMYTSIKRILREMARYEAMSKIHSQEWNERMRACRRAFDTATSRKIKHLRNERTKHK